jgi:ribonuclease E
MRAPAEEPPRHAFEAEAQTHAPITRSAELPERTTAVPERPAPASTPSPSESVRTVTAESAELFVAPAAAPLRPVPEVRAEPAPAPDLEEVLKETGLVMIETQAGKAQSVVASAAEEPTAPRPPRERRPPPPDLNEPLQQVETRKEEDQPSA